MDNRILAPRSRPDGGFHHYQSHPVGHHHPTEMGWVGKLPADVHSRSSLLEISESYARFHIRACPSPADPLPSRRDPSQSEGKGPFVVPNDLLPADGTSNRRKLNALALDLESIGAFELLHWSPRDPSARLAHK